MTDKSKELYRLENDKAKKRLAELEEIDNPTSRKSELAAARQLLEQAINSGNQSVANSLLNTIDRLGKNQFKEDLVRHSLLTKPAVHRFCEAIVTIFAEEIQGLDGWEDALIRVSDRIDEALSQLSNEPKDLEKLSLPR